MLLPAPDLVGGEVQVYAKTWGGEPTPGVAPSQPTPRTRPDEPSITGLANGGFVVSWVSHGQDGDGRGIYLQRYDVRLAGHASR